jgi:lipoprotein-releasing system permease protein
MISSQDLAFRIANKAMQNHKGGYSKMISLIASATVALGIATLLISSNVYKGFKHEIVKKLFCFAPHIEITRFDTKHTFEELPLLAKNAPKPADFPDLDRVELFIQKAGLLKAPKNMAGVVVRGVDQSFDQENFQKHLLRGSFFSLDSSSRKIVLGQKLASQLDVDIDSALVIYFVNQASGSAMPRPRKLWVAGVYRTGIDELDGNLVLTHIDLLRELNKWDSNWVGGYGLYVKDFANLKQAYLNITDQLSPELYAETIKEKYPHFFEWFLIIGQNVTLILTIILFVASFNIAASMLILIIEKTSFIGTLKALGASSALIRKIFFFTGLKICFKGLFYGNILGLIICFLQKQFEILPLKAEMYYLDKVPIAFDWLSFVKHNMVLIPVIFLALFIPTGIILSISPIKAIKFQ